MTELQLSNKIKALEARIAVLEQKVSEMNQINLTSESVQKMMAVLDNPASPNKDLIAAMEQLEKGEVFKAKKAKKTKKSKPVLTPPLD